MTARKNTPFLGEPLFGTLRIPNGVTEIPSFAFHKDENIKKVIIPPSVRSIGSYAFANCKALESVTFSEGLETIGAQAFSRCPKLESLVLPDSVTAFQTDDLPAPVFNRSQTVLFHVPQRMAARGYTVPDGVKRIASYAFQRKLINGDVILPETLEEIEPLAFFASHLKKIVIPASVRRVAAHAFDGCQWLLSITIAGKDTLLEPGAFSRCPLSVIHGREKLDFQTRLALFGLSFAQVQKVEPPKISRPNAPKLLILAEKCGRGDTAAMMRLADYFESLGREDFFLLAANAWRWRACDLGDEEGKAWLESWRSAHPQERLPVLFPTPISGSFHEGMLRHAGFLFFNASSDEESDIHAPDKNGVVEISKLTDEDGPDEDGFGREYYYSYWYVNEHLARLPGVEVLADYSSRDRHNHEARFEARYAQAVEAIRKEKAR